MINRIFIMLFAALAFVGCETISEGDRFEPADSMKSRKIVLLEEFTGVRCTNCPSAAAIAADLLKALPNNLVVVGLHGSNTGSFGKPFDGDQDFRVAGVEEIFEAMGGSTKQGYPCGIINRQEYDGSLFLNSDQWAGHVVNELTKDSASLLVDIHVVDDASLQENQVKIDVDVETLIEMQGNYSLVVQLVEDGIVGSQIDNGKVVKDYVHNHVLRSFVNGVWGEGVTLASEGGKITESFTITLDDLWVKDNCSIIAYVYDASSKRNIVQAVMLPLGSGTHH